ncbi:hypothetical protein M409DRAFT_63377 [Zasmidium cellare ATCC 36951]|uniref:Ketoreductase domain-containing protein n=1 Tax=Zasmidium cellare ATCC 36951 TaxID=1080233 RepID=A0A6A6CXP2_ZASCE|nr:uncharacterized protein M409DRAFT_63377 [Zasmidium cellare ATCC 36951]KAF2171805.1 hypothetical protein M409DRAFT_63377 [Zasmidium cellare ATCC 36951]
MAFGYPSYTSKVHRSEYPAISPDNPANSVEGRVALITGGGAGIGLTIAEAFLRAHAKAVVLLGRRENILKEAAESLKAKHSNAKVLTFPADVTDAVALDKAFDSTVQQVGPVDIVVANAGYMPKAAPLAEVDLENWWKGFEINIYGTAVLFRAWLPYRSKGDGTHKPAFISVNTSVAHLMVLATYSAYAASKSGLATMLAIAQAENPDLHVVSFHPGVVETDMSREIVKGTGTHLDSPTLPAAFAVWLSSPAAAWLGGKFVWAQWDVDELIERKEEILKDGDLRIGLLGWPKYMQATVETQSGLTA